jgi:phenylpropionate dioxygenase-like ring-hydroxylating dioxygenase large terminal subunit
MAPMNLAPATFTHSDFPKNAWYAAAWDTEVKRRLLPRTICGRHVVLYRRTDDVCVALENARWHRLLPLSQGRLEGDDVVCGYHGLIYNPQGRCVYMPSQETINPAACVRSYPVFEKHRFVWLWAGDPAQADPSKIPRISRSISITNDGCPISRSFFARCGIPLLFPSDSRFSRRA